MRYGVVSMNDGGKRLLMSEGTGEVRLTREGYKGGEHI